MTRALAKALIAEDEAPQRDALRQLLAELWPELSIVAECEDGLTALEALHDLRPDVAFLDIRMPGLSGLDIARTAREAHVVFTTAYDEYAVQAFERGAIDYVLKPVRRERLAQTVVRVCERLTSRRHNELTAVLDELQQQVATTHASERIQWITASAGATTKLFSIDEVVYFKAQDKYTCVVTANDQAHIRTPLKELMAGLDSQVFWQVHRSLIVRAAAIRALKKTDEGKLVLQLKGSTEDLPVSAAFQHKFKPM